MRWGKRGHAARGYHHGNLKEALVRAALELIAEKGPAGFTFADAARWAGVARLRRTVISATARRCSPTSRAAASSNFQPRWRKPGTKADPM